MSAAYVIDNVRTMVSPSRSSTNLAQVSFECIPSRCGYLLFWWNKCDEAMSAKRCFCMQAVLSYLLCHPVSTCRMLLLFEISHTRSVRRSLLTGGASITSQQYRLDACHALRSTEIARHWRKDIFLINTVYCYDEVPKPLSLLPA